MAPSFSSKTSSTPLPNQEGNDREETQERHRFGSVNHHQPSKSRRPGKISGAGDRVVSCTDCRPSYREIVPVDNHHFISPSSNGIFKSIIAGISRRGPKPPPSPREERWRIAVEELSRKLVQATRKREEAIQESISLKSSIIELEKKLNRLEIYCGNLKSGFETFGFSPGRVSPSSASSNTILMNFLKWVDEARSSIQILSTLLTCQLKLMGVKVFDRLSSILRLYDINLLSTENPRNIALYFEALLNVLLFENFESARFEKSSTTRVLNVVERCTTNYVEFTALKGLTWDEVLNKGTKHFSEDFSRFCDRKMSEIVTMLGWNKAWPEQLLQAFFGASKSVWLVHFLANSVHPSLIIFRVEKGVQVDPVYMEDVSENMDKKLQHAMVRIMVAPGFYIYDNVIKCKVIYKYYDSN